MRETPVFPRGTPAFRGGTQRRTVTGASPPLAGAGMNRYRAGPMRIALFLPHVGVFGGVRRFVELGNAWSAMGHEVRLFHPEGRPPDWLPFAGVTHPLAEAAGLASDL